MTINFSKFNSLFSVMNYFNTEDKCREAIAQSRWTDGDVVCPYCGQHHCRKRQDKRYCGLLQKVRFTGHFSGKREDVAPRARSKVKPQVFSWIDMERRLSFTAIWCVKPKAFTVASGGLIA